MKTKISTAVALFGCAMVSTIPVSGNAQDPPPLPGSTPPPLPSSTPPPLPGSTAGPKSIEEIRAEYAAVSGERLTAFEIPFRKDEVEGSLTLRYKGGEIRSASAGFGHEHWAVTISSFYQDGAPFFVLVEDSSWRSAGEGKTEDWVEEMRFYIVEGKVIRTLEKKFKGRSEKELKAAALKAGNREVKTTEAEALRLLRKARLMPAARTGAHAAEILLSD